MINAPHFSKAALQTEAAAFLDRYHPSDSFPVPIEEIVEFGLGLEIVPLPSLRSSLGIDAYISSDLQRITVDEELMEKRYINRYRFTLAHEVGHKRLHGDFIRALDCSNMANWRMAMSSISTETYGWIEWHANCFANLVLMPPVAFDEEIARLKSRGYSMSIVSKLASRFGVSPQAVELRLKHMAAVIS